MVLNRRVPVLFSGLIKLPDSGWGRGWWWSVLAGRRPARLFTVLCFIVKSSGSSEFSNRWLSWFQMYLVYPGDDYEIYFWGSGPKKAAHLDDLTER